MLEEAGHQPRSIRAFQAQIVISPGITVALLRPLEARPCAEGRETRARGSQLGPEMVFHSLRQHAV
jgi:hypothetical protein